MGTPAGVTTSTAVSPMSSATRLLTGLTTNSGSSSMQSGPPSTLGGIPLSGETMATPTTCELIQMEDLLTAIEVSTGRFLTFWTRTTQPTSFSTVACKRGPTSTL